MPLINRCGGGSADLQTKSKTPLPETKTYYPDSGYDGFSSFTVGAIPPSYKLPSHIQEEKTWTPTDTEQTIIHEGAYCSGAQKIAPVPIAVGTKEEAGGSTLSFDIGKTTIPRYFFAVCSETDGEYIIADVINIADFSIIDGNMYAVGYKLDGSWVRALCSTPSLSMNGTILTIKLNDTDGRQFAGANRSYIAY